MKEANDLANHQSPRIQIPRKRKRQASESNSQAIETQLHSPASAWYSSRNHHPRLYDLLSEIALTRRALEEFDRRNELLPEQSVPSAPALVENPTESLPLRSGEIPIELKRFARKGGPDISDLKGFPRQVSLPVAHIHDQTHASSPSSTMPSQSLKRKGSSKKSGTSQSTKSNPKDVNFMRLMEDHGVHRPDGKTPPSNHAELTDLLSRRRNSDTSVRMSEEEFAQFQTDIEESTTEEDVFHDVVRKVFGGTRYPKTRSNLCINWAPLFEDPPLSCPRPDRYEGLKQSSENVQLRQHLDKFIVPSPEGPFLANFFFEGKGKNGKPRIAKNQALYYAAYGCRGIHEARRLSGVTQEDEKACTFSATFIEGHLRLYAHFVGKSDHQSTLRHYQMWPLGSWAVDGTREQNTVALTAFRNVRDEAHRMRTAIAGDASRKLELARKRGETLARPDPPVGNTVIPVEDQPSMEQVDHEEDDDEDSSEDELAGDMGPPSMSSQSKRTKR